MDGWRKTDSKDSVDGDRGAPHGTKATEAVRHWAHAGSHETKVQAEAGNNMSVNSDHGRLALG